MPITFTSGLLADLDIDKLLLVKNFRILLGYEAYPFTDRNVILTPFQTKLEPNDQGLLCLLIEYESS